MGKVRCGVRGLVVVLKQSYSSFPEPTVTARLKAIILPLRMEGWDGAR